MIALAQAAWRQAGLSFTIGAESCGRIPVTVAHSDLKRALTSAVEALSAVGYRTCWECKRDVSSVYAFSETAAVCFDLSDGTRRRRSLWQTLNGAVSPSVALLGPDGVGKSTALRLTREWFERHAPFVQLTVHQWRPSFLPSLASLAGKPESPDGDNRPRRTAGKGQLLRLTYYYLDFLIGSWWKDRNRGQNLSRLIVYDRCALDMTVDPFRFALKSRRGTRLLWKLSPRPQVRVLLYDTAERIAHRKDDLQQHEIAEQLETWLKLAAEDEVHAIIRVNAAAEEIASRIRDLFIEAFIRRHNRGVESRSAAPALMPALGFDSKPGAATHAIVPNASKPRFVIPLCRRPAAASLAIYNAQRPLARLAKSALRLGLRLGIAQPLLKNRIHLPLQELRERLDATLGYSDASIAVSLGTPGPNQKPALQIMNREGAVLAYAKIGWNARTIASIRNEHEALANLEQARLSTAILPRVLDAGWMGDRYLLVQSAPEERVIGPVPMDDRHVRFLAELHLLDSSTGPLPVAGEAGDLRRAGLHYYAHLIDRVHNEYSHFMQVPYGPGHGDFTPWNIRETAGKLLVFDWETFDRRMPAGWDLFHLLVAGEVEVRGAAPGAIYRAVMNPGAMRDRIENYFLAIGADYSLIEPLFVSYAAHALATSVLQLGEHADAKDRALQRTWAALLALTCNPGAVTTEQPVACPAVEEAV